MNAHGPDIQLKASELLDLPTRTGRKWVSCFFLDSTCRSSESWGVGCKMGHALEKTSLASPGVKKRKKSKLRRGRLVEGDGEGWEEGSQVEVRSFLARQGGQPDPGAGLEGRMGVGLEGFLLQQLSPTLPEPWSSASPGWGLGLGSEFLCRTAVSIGFPLALLTCN